MDKQAFRRIAGRRTLHLRVVKDVKRHRKIGLVVDIHVADALVVLEDGNERGFAHRADETLAAARNRHVDESDRTDHLRDRRVIEDLD